MIQPTHTVLSGYRGRDGAYRVYVQGHQGALIADETFDEGAAVIVVNGRAKRPAKSGGN